MSAALPVVVASIRDLSPTVAGIRLRAQGNRPLPRFAAGAHLRVQVPNGLLRSYSLCSDPAECGHYDIAVGLAAPGRGGSAYLFNEIAEGDVVLISAPVEGFRLQPARSHHVFVAGGIGITPFVAMGHALKGLGVPFTLHYAARTAGGVPLELLSIFEGRLELYAADCGRRLDLARVLATHDADDAGFYFCGPPRLMSEARGLTRSWRSGRAAFESFADAPVGKVPAGEPFVARIRSSGRAIPVSSGETLLERLRGEGFEIGSSCEHGTCGSCRLRYVGGVALHRDAVLDAHERAQWLTPCVSRAAGELLLDL